jgi:hypothetical protein
MKNKAALIANPIAHKTLVVGNFSATATHLCISRGDAHERGTPGHQQGTLARRERVLLSALLK